MGNVIQTNVASLNSQRNLFRTNITLNETFQRLSSGFRINSAKDDAAGLQISNQLTSQIKGLTIGIRNANDGLSVAQVGEGAQQEITFLLQRMRELALTAATGTTADGGPEKLALDSEFQELILEIDRIATTTSFGGTKLLDGSFGTKQIQVGANDAETIGITLINATTLQVISSAIDITTAANASGVLATIDSDITNIDSNRAQLGAVQNRLTSTIANSQNIIENASASRSRLRDTDYAIETSNLAKNQVLQQAGLSVLSQANAQAQSVLSLLQT
ncbi:MAG: flagellin FliC [Gammaproteobacteria bacterium]|nr:flagellin FliC [Gammaproteobacteria bacterium]NNJ71707.1 flagellin FliC [Enterobacterales bacterium]